MKKNSMLWILILLLGVVNETVAQSKGYVGFSLGAAIPAGDFASSDANSDKAGFAVTGASFDVSVAYKFDRNFGLAVMLRGQANGVDAQKLADAIAEETGVSNSVTVKSWNTGSLMLGLHSSVDLIEKLSFEANAVIGYANCTSPEIKVTYLSAGNDLYVRQKSAVALSFAYLVGAGFKWDIAPKTCLLLKLDYMAAKPQFKDVEVFNSYFGYDEVDFKQQISTVSASIGVGLRL